MRIREFSPTDIPAVTRIVKESLGEKYPPSLYLTLHNLWPEGFLVVQEERKLVAFVAAVISGTKMARVLMLAVLPGHRRRSIGRRLMESLYASCLSRGVDAIVLEVRKGNKDAVGFYEREGFSITGEIRNFYSNGEDALKLMKVLSS